jgi:peptidoglycan hydrolase-like protein with peptidoglycan-binding domain
MSSAAQGETPLPESRYTNRPALVVAGAALAITVGVTFAVTAASGRHTVTTTTASAQTRAGGSHGAAAPLRVLAVTPAAGTTGVDGAAQVRVAFSGPLAAGSPMPRLSPAVSGTWSRQGDTVTFSPSAGFPARTHVSVTVPAGSAGVRGTDGAVLATRYSAGFVTGTYSTLRLQQILAQLGYLPLTWTPVLGDAVPASAAAELSAAYRPPQGTFSWQGDYPSSLTAEWREGAANLIDTGAIMAFQADHGLDMDGQASPSFWAALLRAAADDQRSEHGYTYALASKGSPQTLTIWHDGRRVFSSPANTGIPVAPTADGTYPVYERLRYQVMTGTNPDGSHYADPVEYVAYFDGGEAVHYFPRYSYGFPQSLGCVELPLTAAATAWSYLSYGSLVTVS